MEERILPKFTYMSIFILLTFIYLLSMGFNSSSSRLALKLLRY